MDIMINIRRLKKSDIIKLHNISKKILNISLSKCYSKKLVEAFLNRNNRKNILQKSKDRTYFVAENKKSRKIVGFIAIKENEITSFGVDPDFQKLGIGKELFNKATDLIKNQGFKKIVVSSSVFGVKIYERLGFKFIKKRKLLVDGLEYIDTWMEYKIR